MTINLFLRKRRKLWKLILCSVVAIGIVKGILTVDLSFYLKALQLARPINGLTNTSYFSYNKTKHILLWTRATASPFVYFETGNSIFVKKKCKWKNCYVTSDENYLGDLTEFEVVAFNGPQLLEMIALRDIPRRRSLSQKYVYANIESAANYPICLDVWNEFFNWTWTYKLNSDGLWGYMAIRNATHHVVGPSQNMQWLRHDEMSEIDKDLKLKLKTKTRVAAWFASSCISSSLRENYVEKLQKHLKKYNLMVHVYGKCGEYECPVQLMSRCLKKLDKDYYFYLAFENGMSEDYVTEKVVYALQHDTVPIVFGGANYTRFMPDGSYLNALKLKPAQLAGKMYQIMKHPAMYHDFFRWKKHYSYHLRHESPETDDYCNFCAMLNNEQLMRTTTIYDDFGTWWTGVNKNSTCHPSTNSFIYDDDEFMPDGSYLNALKLKPAQLAGKMYQIMKHPAMYHDFFRWKKHYSYHLRHESPETDDYCNFCAMLNNEQLMRTTTIYDDFGTWWTGVNKNSTCHPSTNSFIYDDDE